jgi:ZIP family zinc transporter
MVSLAETIVLSAIMGLSIYLSLPIVLSENLGHTRDKLFNAVAIGILIFLIADVFLDAASSLYNGSLYGYGSSPGYDTLFASSMIVGFGILLLAGHRGRMELTPAKLALIIAVGIGFQNLTEGLLFGSLGVTLGLTGATLVVLVGFIFQNATEGFPIASPFRGASGNGPKPLGLIAGALTVGGLPTILGGAVGFYYNSIGFDLLFDGLAVGTMLYVILPMLRSLLGDSDPVRLRVAYGGIFLGFLLGFVVNLL